MTRKGLPYGNDQPYRNVASIGSQELASEKMVSNCTYCVATVGEANESVFHSVISKFPGEWHLVTTPSQLTSEFLHRVKPRVIFFPHWRWKVPTEIVAHWECIAFHSTDLPFGRGGSPIQNMIQLGLNDTRLTAFRMTDELDAGPIYLQRYLSLDGAAHEIFARISLLVSEMIAYIIQEWPTPAAQVGRPTYFKRRTPDQSDIINAKGASELYNLIRMLDSPDYPRAFRKVGKFHIEFKDATLVENGLLEAKVLIRERT